MQDIKIDAKNTAFNIDIFEYAFSPIKSKYKELQRIVTPEIKHKIKIFGKRLIKEETEYQSIKIYRIQNTNK